MNSTEYKLICSRPDVLSKYHLEKTLIALKKEGASEVTLIAKTLLGSSLPIPEKYSGTKNQCYFKVCCNYIEAENIIEILLSLEGSSLNINGEATTETDQYVDLVNIWSKLTEYVN